MLIVRGAWPRRLFSSRLDLLSGKFDVVWSWWRSGVGAVSEEVLPANTINKCGGVPALAHRTTWHAKGLDFYFFLELRSYRLWRPRRARFYSGLINVTTTPPSGSVCHCLAPDSLNKCYLKLGRLRWNKMQIGSWSILIGSSCRLHWVNNWRATKSLPLSLQTHTHIPGWPSGSVFISRRIDRFGETACRNAKISLPHGGRYVSCLLRPFFYRILPTKPRRFVFIHDYDS